MTPRMTEEQLLLKENVERILDRFGATMILRRQRETRDPMGFPPDLWHTFAECGIAGVLIPEEYGGAGFGITEACLVMAAIGGTLAPLPFLSASVLAARVLTNSGTAQQKKALLSSIASGHAVIALALDEGPKHEPAHSELSVGKTHSGYILNGLKSFVIDGQCASHMIVVPSIHPKPEADDDFGLFIVSTQQPGIAIEPIRLLDARMAARVEFNACRIDEECVLGTRENRHRLLTDLLTIGTVAVAAELCGIAQECARRTIEYLKQRRQFGRLIGSFQALQHRAAKMYAEVALSRSVTFKAAQAIDSNSADAVLLASVAKARAGSIATLAVQEGLQMHGGIGMTDAIDIGLFMKRARVCQEMFGDVNYHLNRVAVLHGY